MSLQQFTVRWCSSLFFDEQKELKSWDVVKVQIFKTWSWKHKRYWKFTITPETLKEIKANFDNNVRKIELAVDENHEPNHRALWRYKELYFEWEDKLFAKIELTRGGARLLNDWAYKYFSPEVRFEKDFDEETGKVYKNLLIGGGFTNRPFFKWMSSLKASENPTSQDQAYTDNLYFVWFDSMKKIKELLAKAKDKKFLPFAEKNEIMQAFSELDDKEKEEVQQDVQTQVDKPSEEPQTQDDGWDGGNDDANDTTDDKSKSSVKASERFEDTQTYNEMLKEINMLKHQQRVAQVEKKFNENFAFSEQNQNAIFSTPSDKERFMKLYMTFSAEQEKMFDELIGKLDLSIQKKFSEVGYSTSNAWSQLSWNDNGGSEFAEKHRQAVAKKQKEYKEKHWKELSYTDACMLLTKDDLQ